MVFQINNVYFISLQVTSPLTLMLNHQVIVDAPGVFATTQSRSSNKFDASDYEQGTSHKENCC